MNEERPVWSQWIISDTPEIQLNLATLAPAH